jgi:hypothetical protein
MILSYSLDVRQLPLDILFSLILCDVGGCGGSVGDVVAQWGMWWLSGECGGSVG